MHEIYTQCKSNNFAVISHPKNESLGMACNDYWESGDKRENETS